MSTILNSKQNEQQNVTAETTPENRPFIRPVVDIYQTAEGYELVADLPGVNKGGVELHVEDNTLTLVGRRSARVIQGQVIHGESLEADYRRVFELEPAIDAGRISARLDDGVLTVVLPKSEKLRPRKITVQE